jgi:hypothetical protein
LVRGTVYDFQPEGIEFTVPVQLRVEYDSDSVPDSVLSEEHLRIYEVVDGGWEKVIGSQALADRSEVKAEINGFSVLGVLGLGPGDALWGGIARLMGSPVRLFSGDSVGFEAFAENAAGEWITPASVLWSVSDTTLLRLSHGQRERCFVKGRAVGDAFLAALIENEFADSVEVSVTADDRTPAAVGVIDRAEPPFRTDFVVSLLISRLGQPEDVIWAHVLDYTAVYTQSPTGSLVAGGVSDLTVGDTIRAWSLGGVWLSQPGQFPAGRIVITGSGANATLRADAAETRNTK